MAFASDHDTIRLALSASIKDALRDTTIGICNYADPSIIDFHIRNAHAEHPAVLPLLSEYLFYRLGDRRCDVSQQSNRLIEGIATDAQCPVAGYRAPSSSSSLQWPYNSHLSGCLGYKNHHGQGLTLIDFLREARVLDGKLSQGPVQAGSQQSHGSLLCLPGSVSTDLRAETSETKTNLSLSKAKVIQTLVSLGSSLRHRTDPYIDCASFNISHLSRSDHGGPQQYGRGPDPFPKKVFRMLEETEQENLSEIVSFFSHGRAFAVHDESRFVKEILPRYFQQTKWSSFTRQLHLWGFTRIQNGPDAGGFYHELFIRGKPAFCLYMKRVGIPSANVDRRKLKSRANESADPDFYSMKPAC